MLHSGYMRVIDMTHGLSGPKIPLNRPRYRGIAGTSRRPVSKLLACCITADMAEGVFFNVVQLSRCKKSKPKRDRSPMLSVARRNRWCCTECEYPFSLRSPDYAKYGVVHTGLRVSVEKTSRI